MLEDLKDVVVEGNQQLQSEGLVRWTSGNVSARDADSGLMVIKPSGVAFDDLHRDVMVVMNLDGEVVEGNLKPSSDAWTHLAIYRERDDVFGVTHTHSNYATAWAATAQPLPCALTAMADVFGGDVPLGDFCLIGSEAIGKEVVRKIGRSPAILMQNHGVFTIGKSVHDAVKAAVMVEDAAQTLAIAKGVGQLLPIPAEEVAKLNDRYQNEYGQ